MCSVGVAGAGPASDISRGARAGLGSNLEQRAAGAGPASDINRGARAGLGSDGDGVAGAGPEEQFHCFKLSFREDTATEGLAVSLSLGHHGHHHHFSLSQGVHAAYSDAF